MQHQLLQGWAAPPSAPRTNVRRGPVRCNAAAAPEQAQISRRDLLNGTVSISSATVLTEYAIATAAPAEAAVLAPSAPATPTATPAISAACPQRGVAAYRDPWLNRGLTMETVTREALGVQGLLPSVTSDLDLEITRVRAALARTSDPLTKYQMLMALKEQNAYCFYTLLQENVQDFLPVLYTPTVGDACLSWGTLLPRPTGLYLSYTRDRGRVREALQAWPETQVKIAVITDGERILGLGDLGAQGMGIPVGKSVVYGGCGVDPRWVLPVGVDVGCNADSVRDDPLYVGTRQPRVPESEYTAFMDEVVQAIQDRYGGQVIIHWEDVGSRHSFQLLKRLRARGVSTFNDDIECTAAVTVAALLGAARKPGVLPLTKQRFLFFGAGQANIGCAALLLAALRDEGLSEREARSHIWMMDSKGLLLSSRTDMSPAKQPWAQDSASADLPAGTGFTNSSDLLSIVRAVQPTTLIGAASRGGAFTQPVIAAMSQAAERAATAQGADPHAAAPVIFALSNPTSKAECTYEQAYEWTGGRVVFASGTAFPPITVDASTGAMVRGSATSAGNLVLQGSQANNCYVFPGIGLGAIAAGAADVTEGMLLAAARSLADYESPSDTQTPAEVLPRISELRGVTRVIAAAVAAAAAVDMVAALTPGTAACLASLSTRVALGTSTPSVRVNSARKTAGTGGRVMQDCVDRLIFDARREASMQTL